MPGGNSVFDDDGHVWLIDRHVMWRVLDELTGVEADTWRGDLRIWPQLTLDDTQPPLEGHPAGGPAYVSLELNDVRGNQVIAKQSDHLVWVFKRLICISDEEYRAR